MRASPEPDDAEFGVPSRGKMIALESFPADEEILPPKFLIETFPVGKHRTFSEPSLRRLAPSHRGEPPHWLREQEGPSQTAVGATTHHWFSERKVPHAVEHHRASGQGLPASRSGGRAAFQRAR
mmetsp:Transcript_38146/g.118616  ORF Transcript_38146/g.118616 Transcript_38146/m.118616 type:complete len:124 (-) Transcript_38146:56-427(-)